MLYFLMLLFISCQAGAVQTAKVAIIDFFPFGYADTNGKPTGMFVDMLKVIQQKVGIPLQPILLPVPRAIRAVSSGELDMLISYKDPIMVPNVKFVGNIGCLSSLLVPSHNINMSRLEDLNNKTVGFITGGYFHKRFSENYGIIPMQVPSNESMMRMLIRGRVDVIVINSAVLNAYLNDKIKWVKLAEGWKQKIGHPVKLESMETHLSISMKSPYQSMSKIFTQAINEAYLQGKFNSIYTKYGAGSSACDMSQHY